MFVVERHVNLCIKHGLHGFCPIGIFAQTFLILLQEELLTLGKILVRGSFGSKLCHDVADALVEILVAIGGSLIEYLHKCQVAWCGVGSEHTIGTDAIGATFLLTNLFKQFDGKGIEGEVEGELVLQRELDVGIVKEEVADHRHIHLALKGFVIGALTEFHHLCLGCLTLLGGRE